MQRLYNVYCVVENPTMQNYGKEFQLNATPMTHKEACTLLSKLSSYKWRRNFLKEIV